MNVIVVGGGAAGFFAAVTCAEANPRCGVTILEKSRAVLSRVRVSGGGRCNVAPACFDAAELIQFYPRGGKALRGPFTRFQPRDTVTWFEQHGVALKTESDGRMFPVTDRSETIVDCLQEAARQSGVEIHTRISITTIERSGGGFTLRTDSSEQLEADRILLATGSNRQGYAWAEALGHTIVPPVPSLFTFEIDDARLRDLAGVSVAEARVQILGTRLAQRGPVLITHWGLSGPAILKLSAWGARVLHEQNYRAQLAIDWLPQRSEDEAQQHLQHLKIDRARQKIGAGSPLGLPLRLWQRLLLVAEIDEGERWSAIAKGRLADLLAHVKHGVYELRGKGAFKEEFVTCGGVNLDEVNFRTMESRLCPGLYFAGEILDIDGVTGGYNFQAAWTTGWLAGKALVAD